MQGHLSSQKTNLFILKESVFKVVVLIATDAIQERHINYCTNVSVIVTAPNVFVSPDQVVYDGENLRPVVGGYSASPNDCRGEYDLLFGLEGEYKFAM